MGEVFSPAVKEKFFAVLEKRYDMKSKFIKTISVILISAMLCGFFAVLPTDTLAVGQNEAQIAAFLSEKMGLNRAAVSGILANIEWESGFDPTILGDNGTSYGICQWHNSRWDRMKDFCKSRGYKWEGLEGQLWYLKYELEEIYPSILSYIKSVPETAQGAYDAAYYWCKNFERPADTENMSQKRGTLAKNKYWPIYSQSYSTVAEGVYRLKNKSTGTYMTVKDGSDANGQNVELGSATARAAFILSKVMGTVYNLRADCSAAGRMVNIYATTVASGKNVTLYDRTDDASQQWFFEKVTGGYVVRSVADSSLALDIDGTNILVKTYTGAATQIWEMVNISKYTVKYDANGGKGAPSAQTKNHGKALKLSTTVPTLKDYVFKGWATTPDAVSAEYAAGGSLTYNGDLTLYAVWELEPCEGSGGTGHRLSLVDYTAAPTCTEAGRGNYYCWKCSRTMEMTLESTDTVTPWLEEPLSFVPDEYTDTKTQYRYSDGSTVTETVKTGEGTVQYASFPEGFDKTSSLYKKYNVSAADTQTRKFDTEKTVVGYIYWHWCSSKYTATTPGNFYINDKYSDGTGTDRPYDLFHAFFSEEYSQFDTSKKASYFVNADACHAVYWWQEPIPVYSVKYTDYNQSEIMAFGEWQDEPLPDPQGKICETRTLYKYTLSAPGHDYAGVVTPPTCTENGCTVFTCRRCGDTYTGDTVKAPGHQFAETVVAPTCTEDGYTVFTCRVCSYSYTGATVLTPGHVYDDTVTPPTCTEGGYTTHTCRGCGRTYTDSETAPTGHTMHLDEVVSPPTCTENASGRYKCRSCGENYTAPLTAAECDTGWLEEPLSAVPESFAETRTQYRQVLTGDKTVTVKTGSGSVDYASFPAGYDKTNSLYKKYNVSVKSTATRKFSSTKKVVGYIYWHWCSSSYTVTTPSNLFISREYVKGGNGERAFDVFHAFYSTTYVEFDTAKDATYYVNASACPKVYWWQEPIPVYRVSYTDYKTVTRDDSTPWQDEPINSPDEGYTVETKTLWRYDLSAAGHRYENGKCTVCGEEDPGYVIKGDVNSDKKVNALDGNLAVRMILSGDWDDRQFAACDVNGDGKLNAVDANLIVRLILGDL